MCTAIILLYYYIFQVLGFRCSGKLSHHFLFFFPRLVHSLTHCSLSSKSCGGHARSWVSVSTPPTPSRRLFASFVWLSPCLPLLLLLAWRSERKKNNPTGEVDGLLPPQKRKMILGKARGTHRLHTVAYVLVPLPMYRPGTGRRPSYAVLVRRIANSGYSPRTVETESLAQQTPFLWLNGCIRNTRKISLTLSVTNCSKQKRKVSAPPP